MNANAQKLLAALRSGHYEQGQKRLRSGDRFCCLGVACDIYRRETGDGEWIYDAFVVERGGGLREARSMVFLPDVVREWFGFRTDDGAYNADGASLAELNDDEGKSFAEIADAIEAYEEELFDA